MTAWIKSLRLPICLLACLLTVASFRLANLHISWLAVVAVIFIACATMLQNDWRDRYHDKRKGKLLALQCQLKFFIFLLSFWIISFNLTMAAFIKNRNIGIMLISMIVVGFVYSEIRRIPMVPIVLVSLISGSPALLPVVIGVNGVKHWLLFLSVILIIFGREITKDIDDKQTDGGYKWTIPLVIGNKQARIIAITAILAGFIIAIKVSLMILLLFPLTIISAAMFIHNPYLNKGRIYLDISLALAILTLIILRS